MENKGIKINNNLEKAAEKYANKTLLRAAINVVPYVGGAIDVLISSKASKISEKRILDFINSLSDNLTLVDENKIDKKYLDSDDFFDLIINCFERSSKTRSKLKKDYYAKILTKQITVLNTSTEVSEHYLDIISELNEKELIIATVLFDKMTLDPKWKGERHYNWASKKGLEDLNNAGIIPSSDYEFTLLRLQRVGLLKEVTGTFMNYEGGDYTVTDAFKELMKSLQS